MNDSSWGRKRILAPSRRVISTHVSWSIVTLFWALTTCVETREQAMRAFHGASSGLHKGIEWSFELKRNNWIIVICLLQSFETAFCTHRITSLIGKPQRFFCWAQSRNMTDTDESSHGSWTPLILVCALLLLRWLAYGQGNTPVRFRRWYNMKVSSRQAC
jgi:hypothetical protein